MSEYEYDVCGDFSDHGHVRQCQDLVGDRGFGR